MKLTSTEKTIAIYIVTGFVSGVLVSLFLDYIHHRQEI